MKDKSARKRNQSVHHRHDERQISERIVPNCPSQMPSDKHPKAPDSHITTTHPTHISTTTVITKLQTTLSKRQQNSDAATYPPSISLI